MCKEHTRNNIRYELAEMPYGADPVKALGLEKGGEVSERLSDGLPDGVVVELGKTYSGVILKAAVAADLLAEE